MDNRLGVLEFCAALNGDNPHQVYNILVKFVKTVRRERNEAFTRSSDKDDGSFRVEEFNDDSSFSGDDDFISPPPTKKMKVEKWKLDTKSYNVPFVGTSTNKGSSGTVESGVWPTGFLCAFLNKSPRAMELLGKDTAGESPFMPPHGLFQTSLLKGNDKAGKIQSNKLLDIFIQCLGEVVSCAIPRRKLERIVLKSEAELLTISSDLSETDGVKIAYQNIVSIVMKGYIQDLFNILNNEVNNVSNGRLLLSSLTTLRHLASTSVGTAREVVRGFDTYVKEGVLNRLASYNGGKLSKKKTGSTSTDHDEEMKYQRIASKVQTAVLNLAIVLLEYNDATILSNIISPGVKESNMQTGILYRGIRCGLSRLQKTSDIDKSVDSIEEAHHLAMCRLLRLVRALMCQKSKMKTEDNRPSTQTRSNISNRALVGFIQGEVLDQMVKIYCSSSSDLEDGSGSMQAIRIECKAMVEFLLTDDSYSPILIQMRLERDRKNNSSISSLTNQVNKAIQHLLVSMSDMKTRQFVSSCFNKTPSLFPNWMRTISVPEPRASFSFMSTLALISFMLKNTEVRPLDIETVEANDKKKTLEFLVATIVPRALSKNILTKALHSSNAFLVNETLKLIIVVLRRFQHHTRLLCDNDAKLEFLAENLLLRLPDLMVLLSLRTRFDPFQKDSKDKNSSRSFVLFNLCQALQLYTAVFPHAFRVVQFDWIKLLSDSIDTFLSAPVILQHRLLYTISKIHDCYETVAPHSNSMLSSKRCCVFIAIMLRTPSTSVYTLSRNLAIKVASRIVATVSRGSNEQIAYIEDEVSLWIDGLTDGTLPLFAKLLEAVHKVTIQHSTIISDAWNVRFPSTEIGTINFTPLLSLTLMGVASGEDFPDDFVSLFSKVASKILLSHSNPKLFAALVAHVYNTCHDKGQSFESLQELTHMSTALLEDARDTFKAAHRLAKSNFGIKHFHTQIAMFAGSGRNSEPLSTDLIANTDFLYEDSYALSMFRQCFQHLSLFPHEVPSDNRDIEEIITGLLPIVLQGSTNVVKCDDIMRFYPSNSIPVWMMILLSCCFKYDGQVECRSLSLRIATDIKSRLACLKDGSFGDFSRYLLLISLSLSHFFSEEDLSSVTGSIIEFCLGYSSRERGLNPYFMLLKNNIHYLSTVQASAQIPAYTKLNVRDIFNLWSSLSKAPMLTKMEALDWDLILGLENILSVFISESNRYGFQSSAVMKCIENISTEAFMRLSFQNFIGSSLERHGDANSRLLVSVLSYDVSLFAPHLMKLIPTISGIESADRTHLIDKIISTVVYESVHQNQFPPSEADWFNDAIIVANNRLCSMLSGMTRGEEQPSSFQSTIGAVEKAATHGKLQEIAGDKVLHNVSIWLTWAKKHRKLPAVQLIEKHVLHFLFIISTVKAQRHKYSSNILVRTKGFKSARDAALFYIVKALPKTLKVGNSSQRSETMLSTIFALLQILDVSSVLCLKELIVVCLKFGIGLVGEGVSSSCLQIVRYILTSVYSEDQIKKTDVFSPGQVHSMILSHSNFDELAGKYHSQTRKELLSLLITTLSLANDGEGVIPTSKMSRLLAGFRANVTDDDRLLRRLLYVHETASKTKRDVYFMHDVTWGNRQSNKGKNEHQVFGTDYGQHWEWFIEGLDVQRMYKTISNFPPLDSATPAPFLEIETWVNRYDGKVDAHDDLSSTSDHDEAMDTSSDEENELHGSKKKTKAGGSRTSHNWHVSDEDDRYSPGFIMPFILAVLEAFAELAESEDEPDKNLDLESHKEGEVNSLQESKINPCRETFTKIAYRLFQKGAISLSVMCLSSKCPDLRKLAISVIYRFIQALQMKEAHNIAAWRSRPQIEMVMCSLQRGLLVSRARRVSDETYNEQEKLFIPMLPVVSALFLTRSLTILSRPTDDMYGAINKFFLRLDSDHGAYTDCFSLPAFMTLFCSVNDNIDQARKERLWALKLLKDGTVDDYCYKVVARRHAPELLLSSVDAICSKEDPSSDEGECILLLETIQVLIERGGSSSFHHYFNAVGLLSWIQSTLQSTVQVATSKVPAIGVSYLKLISVALEKLLGEQARDDEQTLPHFDALKIARGVNDLWTHITDMSVEQHKNLNFKTTSASSRIVPTVRRIYSSLYDLETMKGRNVEDGVTTSPSTMLAVHPFGIPLKSSLNLIQSSEDDEPLVRQKLIGSLCYLPMSIDIEKDARDLDTFCQKAVECIQSLENTDMNTDTYTNVNTNDDGRQQREDREIFSHVVFDRLATLQTFHHKRNNSNEGTDTNANRTTDSRNSNSNNNNDSNHHLSLLIDQLLGFKRNLRTKAWLNCFQVLVDLYHQDNDDGDDDNDDASFDDENDYALLLKSVVEEGT